MGLKQRLRTWWQVRTGEDDTPLDCDLPAWLVSFGVHLGLLVLVAMLSFFPPDDQVTLTLTAPLASDTPDLIIPEEFHFDDLPTDSVGSGGTHGGDLAAAIAPEIDLDNQTPTPPDLPVFDFGDHALQDIITQATASNFGEKFAIKGAVGAVAPGAEGAIDRLTQEILLSLEERPTLVVWLFDQSGSLVRQRETIRKRFGRIYNELGIIESQGNRAFHKTMTDEPLLSVVIGFGATVTMITPRPTSDLNELRTSIASIQRDGSGVENVFQAISLAAERYRKLRRINPKTGEPTRNVLLIVFTDEVGNDQHLLDPTVNLCRDQEMPVYVIGVPAPFGRVRTSVKWVDPDPNYDQTPQWGTVDQGPESLRPERLKLRMIGSPDYAIDSGFGPFALTRLCYETGGIYFAIHPNRDTNRSLRRGETEAFSAYFRSFFSPDVMRRYRPDYVSAAEYQQRLTASPMRSALVKAAQTSWVASLSRPRTRFVVQSEAAFVNQLTEAQKAAAKLEPKINLIYQQLQMGEKSRPTETTPRWQAGYDLAMGRALAAKVRTESYNAVLATAKQGMKFKTGENNTWTLAPDNDITTGSQTRNHARKAREYLTNIVEQHPNTPWAMLAQRELKTPLSWRWRESLTNLEPRRRRTPRNNNNPRPPRDDRRAQVANPKPKRPVPKL